MKQRIVLFLSLAVTFVVAPQAFAIEKLPHLNNTSHKITREQLAKEAEDQVWNLKDVDIRTLAYEISKATGKNFVIGPKVKQEVTFITSHRLPKDELYQAFIALLHAYNYAAIPEGDVIKIVHESSRNQLRPNLQAELDKPGEEIVLRTIRVKNFPANDLVKIIKPLIPKYSYVEAYRPSNDLIIADHAQHISKIIALVRRMDQPDTKDFDIVRLKYANAEELAKTISELIRGQGKVKSASTVSVVADTRSNSLVIAGAKLNQTQSLRQLIARLDISDDIANERTEVVYLSYLPAETFAPIIAGLVDSYIAEQDEKKGKKSQNNSGYTSSSTSSSSSSASSNRSSASGFNLGGSQSGLDGGVSTGGTLGTYTAEVPKSGSLGSHVQWEASTNSVIITAPRDIIRRVKSVVTKLDIRRPQVLIEAVIAEVSVDRDFELGVEWQELGKHQVHTRFSPNLPLTRIGTDGGLSASGTAGAIGSGLTLGIFKNMSLHALVTTLANDGDSNVLATPNLVTLDNEPALIKVGRKVSFATGTTENDVAAGGSPFTSLNREDVGLILSIKPQITPNGAIRLNITQELSNVLAGTEASRAGQNPDTSERFIQTTIMADNGQTLVLGGLLQKDWIETVSKVPLIGDIPVVGAMFRNHYKSLRKTNLMIFLHPVILYGPHDNDMVTTGKYEFLRQSQLHLDHDLVQHSVNPVLPIRHSHLELPKPFCE